MSKNFIIVTTFRKIAPENKQFTFIGEEKFEEVTVKHEFSSRSQLFAALLYARWQFEKYHYHSNVDLFLDGVWYYGAL